MYQVTQQYLSEPIFKGSKSACRKFLQSKVSGRLRKAVNHDWESERNVFCWDSQTEREFEVTKI
jgi:hypothetical protein